MASQDSSAVVFSGYHPIEVTDSDFLKTVERTKNDRHEKTKHSPHKSMTKRIGGLLSSSRKKKDAVNQNNDSDRHSISGFSNTGQHSIASNASKTVDSGITIKASNLHQGHSQKRIGLNSSAFTNRNFTEVIPKTPRGKKGQNSDKHKRPPKWRSFKRLVVRGRHNKHQFPTDTSQSSSDVNSPTPSFQRRHAKSHDGAESFQSLDAGYPMRKRFYSEGVDGRQQKERFETMSFSGGYTRTSESQHVLDQVIRGRLDGMDVLGLGPAGLASDPVSSSKTEVDGDATRSFGTEDAHCSDTKASFDPLHTSFTNLQSSMSPANLIDEMIWTSAGMDQSEIIFEGFYPGGSDRWGVRIATRDSSNDSKDVGDASVSLPTSDAGNHDGDESTASNTTDNDGSKNVPIAELWDSLWGADDAPPPMPSHMNVPITNDASALNCKDSNENPQFPNEESQQFAEICNVPIDLDDDAFIIDGPQHVYSVHDVVMLSLQSRRFDSAISIFEKLLRGLDGNAKYLHLFASTSHNIGMVQLCQGKYREAEKSFRKAVKIRKECLPADHPDIAVSLQREGMAKFAQESIFEALKCFEAALLICTSMDNSRAKILNNIGVARYQLEDYAQALKSFTSALEIQRPWLDGPIRRESIVYSASSTLSNMGKVYLRQGDHDLAYFVFEEACLMQTSIFRKDHDTVLRSMDNMARAHAKNENYPEALRILTSLYRSQAARFGSNCDVCIETLGIMGIIHFKLLDYEEAEKCLQQVETWQIETGGMEKIHPSMMVTTDYICQIKRCLQGKEPMWV